MYKRFEMRRCVPVPIELITPVWDEPMLMQASDFSPQGAYIDSELLLDVGEHVVVDFALPGLLRPLSFFAEITRINWLRRLADRGRPGFGMRFLDARPIDRLNIRHALRGFPPPLPSSRRLALTY